LLAAHRKTPLKGVSPTKSIMASTTHFRR
jgi:hypothetical protein